MLPYTKKIYFSKIALFLNYQPFPARFKRLKDLCDFLRALPLVCSATFKTLPLMPVMSQAVLLSEAYGETITSSFILISAITL